MLLILGLGNPGKKYESTRHNAGFFILDKIKERWKLPDFKFNKKINAQISKGKIEDKEITLIKPETFMNLSGESARKALAFWKLAPKDIMVIHDDIDIPLGKYKIARDSRSAGHNGVQNIIDALGTQKFTRLRIGIKNTDLNFKISPEDFVLQKFSDKERLEIEKISSGFLQEIIKII